MRQMPPREEMDYYQLLKQHRTFPLIYAYRPGITVNGPAVTLDWTGWLIETTWPLIEGPAGPALPVQVVAKRSKYDLTVVPRLRRLRHRLPGRRPGGRGKEIQDAGRIPHVLLLRQLHRRLPGDRHRDRHPQLGQWADHQSTGLPEAE